MIGWGIGIIIASLVVLILLRMFFKTAFKIVSIIWLVLFLASIAFGILVYVDMKDIREVCTELSPVVLLQDEGNIIAGMDADISQGGEMGSIDAFIDDLDQFQDAYDDKDFDELLENDYCRIAIFNTSVFDVLDEITFSDELTIDKDVFLGILKASNPIEYFVDKQGDKDSLSAQEKEILKQGMEEQIGTANKLKGMIFAGMLGKAMEEFGPSFILEQYGDKKIEIFKESITFKILKYVPYSVIDDAMEKVTGEEVAAE